MMPVASGERTLGVLEVIAARRRLEGTLSTIEAIASDVGVAIDRLRRREAEVAGAMARGMADLGKQLLKGRDPEHVVRSCVRFCHEQLGVPSAGWVVTADGRRATLVAAYGVGARLGPQGRQGLQRLRQDDGEMMAAAELRERFARVVGIERAHAADLGPAVLVVGDDSEESRQLIEIVGSLFREALEHSEVVLIAERRNRSLDTALASVAHELRGPLLAASAAIDSVLEGAREHDPDLRLLEWSRKELDELAGLIEPLMRWAVTERILRRTRTDLVRLVNGAATSVSREKGERRVSIKSPRQLPVRAAPGHLRSAIANVLRNALMYSPDDSEVAVTIRDGEDLARVTVIDEGPGVKASECEAIFDPFRRGEVGRASRSSQGLGLFIARKVVEAHEGRIWLEPRRKGAVFNIEVPVA
jgi:signal transduction histidine kinase